MLYSIFIGIVIGILINIYIKKSEHYTYGSIVENYLIPTVCVLLILILYRNFGFSKLMLVYSTQLAISVPIAMIDIKTKSIPKSLLLLCFIMAVVFLLLLRPVDILSGIIGCITAGSILLVLYAMTRGGLGLGDILFFGAIGLTLGIEKTISALVLTALISGVFGVIIVLIKKENIKATIPFAPFILLGTLLSVIS